MKGFFYYLAVFMLGISCLCETGCSEDKPGEDKDKEQEELKMVKKLTIDNYDGEERSEIAISRQSNRIDGITWKLSPLGTGGEWEPFTIRFAVAQVKGRPVVTFKDEEGVLNTVTYTLDEKGIVTAAAWELQGYEERAVTWTFINQTQRNVLGRLVMEIPGQGKDEVFQAVCDADGNWTSVLDYACKPGSIRNTASVNLNLLGMGLVDIENPVLSVAVLCGWVAVNPLIIESISGEEEDDEGQVTRMTFVFNPQVTVDRISSLKVKIKLEDGSEMDYLSATLGY